MPSSQIFVDTAEKSVLNLFCKSDTSETSKKQNKTNKILQMLIILSFQDITLWVLNFVGL